jgi:hypothetical protein
MREPRTWTATSIPVTLRQLRVFLPSSNTSLSQTVENFFIAFGYLAQRCHEMVVLLDLFNLAELNDQRIDADAPASGHDLDRVAQFFGQPDSRRLLSHAIMIASHQADRLGAAGIVSLLTRSSAARPARYVRDPAENGAFQRIPPERSFAF